MANYANFTQAGFFNSIVPLNQTNWANYFSGSIQDGVLAGVLNELEVTANSSGMVVQVNTGECRCRSHRGYLSTAVTLDIAAADLTYDRKDLVVARVTYGNPSEMVIAVKTGTPAASPSEPTLTQVAGDVWEVRLALIDVPAGAVTITASNVRDRRYVYTKDGDLYATSFTGTSVTVKNSRHYRNSTAIGSLAITLPKYPSNVWRCEVDFVANSSFSGITFAVTDGGTPTIITDGDLTLRSTNYHLEILWNGQYYRIIAHPNHGAHTNDGVPVLSYADTSITCLPNREHRSTTSSNSMTVTLPDSPRPDFISSIRFPASSSFTGVIVYKGSTKIYDAANNVKTMKLKGDVLNLQSKIYTLVFWWDGTYYWCASAAV